MTTQKTLTVNDLVQAFGVSSMTLYLWRQGTPTKDPLPYDVVDPNAKRPSIAFRIPKVRAWAKKHGIEFAVDPDNLTQAATSKHPTSRKKTKH